MKLHELSVVSLKQPPKSLVKAALPYLRLGSWSLLTYYTDKYLQSSSGIFYSVFVFYKNKIVAWGIITSNFAANCKTNSYPELFTNKKLLLMLYVSKRYRRLKLGNVIIKNLLLLNPKQKVNVIGHNDASWRFFNKMKKAHPSQINIIDWR